MSKLLVINGHPLKSNQSSSLRALDAFLESYTETNPNDEIVRVDLYDMDFPEIDKEILDGWNALRAGESFDTLSASQQSKIQTFNTSTQQFLDADKVVIANALWNFMVPTRVKAWIDTIQVAGQTFRYTAEGPVPLTQGKKALHIQSSGSYYHGQNPGHLHMVQVLKFVGVETVESVEIEGKDYDPSQTEAVILRGVEEAAAKGREF